MSSMLEQAIIDATALREAAIKSAEQAVVEKYSTDIKEAVEKLMEQNDFEENKTVDEQIIEEEEMIDIDVKSLFEQVQKEQLEEEIELDEEINEEADMSPSDVDGMTGEPPMPPDLDEEIELSKELEESLDFDYSPVPKGQTTAYGATRAQQAEEAMLMDVMLAIEEENSELEKKNESLVKTSNELKKSNQKLKETVQNIADKFKEIKLINSKLFYTNKTLMDASLNERQKGNLVESINNAQTSERAKIVYETLKNTVGNATAKEQPKSLSEAVDKRSSTSLLLKAQKSDDKPKVNESNLFANRMQALAGIKHHKED